MTKEIYMSSLLRLPKLFKNSTKFRTISPKFRTISITHNSPLNIFSRSISIKYRLLENIILVLARNMHIAKIFQNNLNRLYTSSNPYKRVEVPSFLERAGGEVLSAAKIF